MVLTAGRRLGPYEIVGALGAGGMGEVYRARDTQLKRDIALKVLPAAVSADADRLARFQREAELLAALNHPNIAHIYGLAEADGVRALVLELVEGQTLADRLTRGALPVADAMAVARQLAEALEFAHERGIVHRDLKPANIKVTPDGAVKVLDFGLAKALAADSGRVDHDVDTMNSPTLTTPAITEAGIILGTAAYMSPEQARGKPVDKRADIWAFGCVLYELLSGHRPFDGPTVSDVLAAVLRADIEWPRLPADTPPRVRRLLARCLERDPKRRLRDIGDARIEIDAPEDPIVPVASRKRLQIAWMAAALLAITSAVAVWGWLHVAAPPAGPVTRAAMVVPNGPGGTRAGSVALSRDGTRMAYWEGVPRKGHLVLRMMDQLESKPIPGSETGDYPVFSPDGQWIAFLALSTNKLKKIPVSGGASIPLCDLPTASLDATWGEDGTIVFGGHTGLMRVADAGGTPEVLTTIKPGATDEAMHYAPQFLPGGTSVLFSISGAHATTSRLAVLDLKTRTYRVLMTVGDYARYVPSGHIVYARSDTLFAVPFDIARLIATGPETPVVDGMVEGDYAFSDTGLLAFTSVARSSQPINATIEWMDKQGVAEPLPEPPHEWYGSLALSPDGKLVAGSIRDSASGGDIFSKADIWKYDAQRTTLARATFEGLNDSPAWTHDGRWVAFRSMRDGKNAIYRVPADASGPPELLVPPEAGLFVAPGSWTPDGRLLYIQRDELSARNQIWILPAGGGDDAKPRRFFQSSFSELSPQASPDGKRMAYTSDESGRREVYVVPLPGPGAKAQISTKGGESPKWLSGGRELLYWESATRQVMAVDMQSPAPGRPRALVKLPPDVSWHDVTPDGLRFLVTRNAYAAPTSSTTLIVVTNWFQDLVRRAPARSIKK